MFVCHTTFHCLNSLSNYKPKLIERNRYRLELTAKCLSNFDNRSRKFDKEVKLAQLTSAVCTIWRDIVRNTEIIVETYANEIHESVALFQHASLMRLEMSSWNSWTCAQVSITGIYHRHLSQVTSQNVCETTCSRGVLQLVQQKLRTKSLIFICHYLYTAANEQPLILKGIARIFGFGD